jgi:hypothetical protein
MTPEEMKQEEEEEIMDSVKEVLKKQENPVEFLLGQLKANVSLMLTHRTNWQDYVGWRNEALTELRAEQVFRRASHAELEKLLAECHAKLKETRELVGDQWVSIREPFEIEQRIENYFAGNGAILYSELEIPEEGLVEPSKNATMLEAVKQLAAQVNQMAKSLGKATVEDLKASQTRADEEARRIETEFTSRGFPYEQVTHLKHLDKDREPTLTQSLRLVISSDFASGVGVLVTTDYPEYALDKGFVWFDSGWFTEKDELIAKATELLRASQAGTGVIVFPHKPMGEILSEIMGDGTIVNMVGGMSTLTLWAHGEIKASFKLPTGYFMRIRTDYGVSTTPAWFLENEVTGENHFLHLVNSITKLSDDEIKVIQARIDEVTA